MAQQTITVRELIDMHSRGELRLPAIQRGYVWRGPRVRDLLDSLYRGYPSGNILVWESDDTVVTRDFAVEQGTNAFTGSKLLLDGQQRITSLAAVVGGKPVHVRGRKREIEILFNLDHPEGAPELLEVESDESSPTVEDQIDHDDDQEERIQERLNRLAFVISSRALSAQKNWVRLIDVFGGKSDAQIMKDAGVASFDDPRYEKYKDRLEKVRKIRDYPYIMHVLERKMSYEEVTEIFVRVNSLGVKLRSSDLALAQISCRWSDVLEQLENFQGECEAQAFTLDTGLLIRAMVVFATKQCFFKPVGSTAVATLKKSWEEAKEGLRFAINFLRSNAGIEDESLLSAPMLMLPLCVLIRLKDNKLSDKESRELLYWLLVSNVRGRYSRGSTETLLNEDLSDLFDGKGVSAMLANLRRQVSRLEVDISDLPGRGVNSSLFQSAYLAIKDAGAKDWQTGLGLSLAHQGKTHYIEYHHIFPKALLRKANYDRAQINEIANLAFIGGQSNRRISSKPPLEYLEEIVKQRGEEALSAQAIPVDRGLWKIDAFPKFLEERRKLLVNKINDFIKKQTSVE